MGNDGADVILGDLGADSLSGGSGDDSLYIDSTDTFFDGGTGFDAAYIIGGPGMSIGMAATGFEWVADFAGGNDTIDGSGLSVAAEIYAGGGALGGEPACAAAAASACGPSAVVSESLGQRPHQASSRPNRSGASATPCRAATGRCHS